ncbi:MAG: YihY/virulence factor BrkB family protein [Paludibacteraceae bacterium]|jgi:membrane protein|nr:YihY/virulence factor BrkB family protein [Paludibacteraceae bacterium]
MKKIIRFILDQIKFITIDIWRTTIHDEQGKRGYLMLFLKTLILSIEHFVKRKMAVRASALTYYSVFALIPIMAFVIGIARGFGFDQYITEMLVSKFNSQGETLTIVLGFVDKYLQNAKGGAFVGIGLGVLLWSILKVFSQVESAFNEIWGIKKNRSFIRRFTDYISLMILVPMLIFVTSGISFYFKYAITYFDNSFIISPTLQIILKFMPWVITWLTFTLVYVVMPNTKVKFGKAAIAGALAGGAFIAFKNIFMYVQTWMTSYNAVYGSLATIPFLLMFLQITWMIILIGAEISFSSQSVRNFEFEKDIKNMSHRYYDFVLLSITKIVTKRFENEERPLTLDEMSMDYRIPLRLATIMVNRLCRAGILVEVRTKDLEDAYQPALDIHKITVAKFFDMVDKDGKETFRLETIDEFSNVWDYTLSIRQTLMQVGNNKLVKDL